ncbi:MAG TPA: GNAT family N-acetyltransferase [Ignavibacteriaceae bacterium]|nr:GNAT family N-acetyltransferase [Ignavibacteriaceae bacterium]
MILSARLKQKIKYNGLLRILHDGFIKTGLKISPFYLVEEKLCGEMPELEMDQFPDYDLKFLEPDEILDLGQIREDPLSKQKLAELIDKGCLCLCLKKNGYIVAYTWIDPCECKYGSYKLRMKENEACLFGVYTLMEHRGKNLAPFIRYQCYKELNKLGKTTFYSISEAINNQSISFKKKLGAKFVLIGLNICLLKKLKFTLPLKRFF